MRYWNMGNYRLTPFGKKAYDMAVNVADRIEFTTKQSIIDKTGKVRLLK